MKETTGSYIFSCREKAGLSPEDVARLICKRSAIPFSDTRVLCKLLFNLEHEIMDPWPHAIHLSVIPGLSHVHLERLASEQPWHSMIHEPPTEADEGELCEIYIPTMLCDFNKRKFGKWSHGTQSWETDNVIISAILVSHYKAACLLPREED